MDWALRVYDDPITGIEDTYPPNSYKFTIIIHRSGKFEYAPYLVYSGGSIAFVDNCDSDRMSIHEIILMANEFGTPSVSSCWYRHPQKDFNNGLIQLVKDRDVLEMTKWVSAYRVIDMYLDHGEKEGVMNDFEPLNVIYPEEDGEMNEEEGGQFGDDESDLGSPLGSNVVCGDDDGVWKNVEQHGMANETWGPSNVNKTKGPKTSPPCCEA